jgi:hypothetical protein
MGKFYLKMVFLENCRKGLKAVAMAKLKHFDGNHVLHTALHSL